MLSATTIKKLVLLLVIIPIGFLTKVYTGFGAEFVHNHLGGIIYVVFFILFTSIFFSKANPLVLSVIVLFVTILLEFTQLIQNPTLNKLRQYFIVRALFGGVFNMIDLLYYIVGALSGYGFLVSLKWKIFSNNKKKKISDN